MLGIGKKSGGGSTDKKNFATGLAGAAGLAVAPAIAPALGAGLLSKAIYDNARRTVKPVQQSREMLAADVAQMRQDPNAFGLSDSEREAYIESATRAQGAQQQAQTTQLAQAALAGTPQAQGQLLDLNQQIAGQRDQAAVGASANAGQLHRQMVEQKVAQVKSELEAERERVKENTRFWLNMGIQGVGAVISAATGGGAGILSGLGGAAAGSVAPAATAAPAVMAPSIAAPGVGEAGAGVASGALDYLQQTGAY